MKLFVVFVALASAGEGFPSYGCATFGGVESAVNSEGCLQVFDSLETAKLACSVSDNCILIGQNRNGSFEIFSESDNPGLDLLNYELSFPAPEKVSTNRIYGQ